VLVAAKSQAVVILSEVLGFLDLLEGRSIWSWKLEPSSIGLSRDLLPGDAIVGVACMKVFSFEGTTMNGQLSLRYRKFAITLPQIIKLAIVKLVDLLESGCGGPSTNIQDIR
jgi:hypothetical protein